MRISGKWLALSLLAVAASVGAVYAWWAGGREGLLQLLRPRFQVVAIDPASRTMQLRQTNRTYTVRCDDACRDFVAGQDYPAIDRGSDLELKVAGRRVRCPIIKIEVHFDVRPGGVGALPTESTLGFT